MDGRVWKSYLRTVLHDHIEEASVILVDNFDSHPLDVGVMAPFKRYLGNLWLYEDIFTGEDEVPFSLTARQKRLALIKRAVAAWEMVSTDAIRGSFEKALPQEPMD
ncbi:hypothetical protein H257_16814 [Aphanomyces astaci]|uniref:DDE-1 domain-containing protein n=1 Tax=Aphanomyces astaci TaxID=112090 RepID=W4FHE8_APHAT|nr:hypothetical protein H257_16814 [Aphanomyces astaci]ETV66885.1 hypothetical protein H257_16814 [Aphanomyces astaci]|eukprot:XP_009843688.1 hypothetical protein H257_16814 [Aphanomyces astaci]